MQEEIAQMAGGPAAKSDATVPQIVEIQNACTSTRSDDIPRDTPKAGATESSVQDKFFESMTSFMEVMKEKETAGTNLKWDRKPPVIKAESPKDLMTEIIDLERLFSELGFKTHRKKWGVFRNALQGKGKEKLEYELERVGMTP